MKKTKLIATYGILIAVAFTLSFLESLVPINFGVPGIKLGFANIVVMFAIYTMRKGDALAISLVRIVINSFVFTGAFSLTYGIAGGLMSLGVMLIAKRNKRISVIGVSVIGAVTHNLAQIIVAGIVMHTYRIVYYYPALLVSGAVTGVIVGILSGIIIARINKINTNNNIN